MPRRFAFILVLLICAVLLIPQASQAEQNISPFGINTHLATRFGNLERLGEPVNVVANSGASWVREDFHWAFIEPRQGVFQWEYFDRTVDQLTARGIQIVGVLGHPPGWATPEPNDGSSDVSFYPPDTQLFSYYTVAVVERYRGRINHWEIWNEPDNPLFWKPAPDALAYANLLSTAYATINQIAPEANVLVGGLNPFDTTFLQQLGEYGAWWAFDIINIHPYVFPKTPEDGNIALSVEHVRELMHRFGDKPIWATEYGWNALPDQYNPLGMSEEDQADNLVRGALLLQAAGVERIFWYCLKDERQNGFGLMRFNDAYDDLSQPRPALTAFTTLNTQMIGATFQRPLDEIAEASNWTIRGLRFTRGDELIDILWAPSPAETWLPTSSDATIFNRNGDRWDLAAENGSLHLFLDRSPIYVHHRG